MDVWWRGPSWLAQPPQHWRPNTPPVDVSLLEGKGSANHTLSVEVPRKLLDPTKYSSYWKLFGSQSGSCAFGELPFEGTDALEI